MARKPKAAPAQPWLPTEIELRPLSDLIAYARNARTHDEAQVQQIAESVSRFGWTQPIIVEADGTIVAGHGRALAAEKLGLAKVPVIVANPAWSEEDRRLYTLADNQLALNAGWDDALLRIELTELQEDGAQLGLIGFSSDDLAKILAESAPPAEPEAAEPYSRKITAPIYRPSDEAPDVAVLVDDSKTRALLAAIDEADLPGDVAAFLEKAAERHTVFDFARIADFYAHAEPEVQRLMEASALVIVDFNQAIENGFVKLTKRLGELASGAPAEDA